MVEDVAECGTVVEDGAECGNRATVNIIVIVQCLVKLEMFDHNFLFTF